METTYTFFLWNLLNKVDVSQWVLCLVSRTRAYKYNVFYRYMYWVSGKQTWLILLSTLHCLCYDRYRYRLQAPVFATCNNDSVSLDYQRILTRPSYRCTRTWYHTCIQCTQYLVISFTYMSFWRESEKFYSLPKQRSRKSVSGNQWLHEVA